jgi:hypothetical protein
MSRNVSGDKKFVWGGFVRGRFIWRRAPAPVRPGRARRCALLLVLGLASIIALAQNTPKPSEDLPPGPTQSKATTSCLECHEARIILQQRLTKPAWTKEVDKMIKWGAVVEPSDRDALIDYLSANFSPDQPQYQPPRTTVEKTSAKNSAAKKSKPE